MKPWLLLGLAAPLLADPSSAPPKPWIDKAALSFVSTGGNAEASTLGFSNEFLYKWSGSQLQANLSAVRIDTTLVSRSATGASLADYTVQERTRRDTTSASYTAGLRYDYKLADRFFWFGAAGWERNVPTGLESRTKGSAGLGRVWIKSASASFRTDLGMGYTWENPVFRAPGFRDAFGTWNLNAKLERKLGASSGLVSELAFTDSLQDGQDYLAVWKTALSSSLNSHFALKVGFDASYRGLPASVGIDLVQAGSEPPVVLGQVPFQLKRLDTVFTTSLVLSF